MPTLLQKGQEFTIASGSGDNTIQSFNGGLGRAYGSMYVDIVVDGAAVVTTPTTVRVTGDNTFTVQVTDASGSSKYEAGDDIELYVAGDKANSVHRAEVVSVEHVTGGHVNLEVFLVDPHTDTHSATATVTTVTRSTRYVSIPATFVPAIPAGSLPLYQGDISSLTVNGGEVSSLTGITAYEYNGTAILMTFNTERNAASAVTNLQAAIATDPDVDITYLATEETFNRLDTEHHIHVGSKTQTTVIAVTPISLPDGLTIRAGANVGDIFLITER